MYTITGYFCRTKAYQVTITTETGIVCACITFLHVTDYTDDGTVLVFLEWMLLKAYCVFIAQKPELKWLFVEKFLIEYRNVLVFRFLIYAFFIDDMYTLRSSICVFLLFESQNFGTYLRKNESRINEAYLLVNCKMVKLIGLPLRTERDTQYLWMHFIDLKIEAKLWRLFENKS